MKTLGTFFSMNADEAENMTRLALKLKEITTPGAKIAIVWAGALSYFSDRYCIDPLGRCDAFIARQKTGIKNYKDFLPGHNKYDYSYSIGKLKPDIVVCGIPELKRDIGIGGKEKEAFTYLDKDYKEVDIKNVKMAGAHGNKMCFVFFRKNSANINWAKAR